MAFVTYNPPSVATAISPYSSMIAPSATTMTTSAAPQPVPTATSQPASTTSQPASVVTQPATTTVTSLPPPPTSPPPTSPPQATSQPAPQPPAPAPQPLAPVPPPPLPGPVVSIPSPATAPPCIPDPYGRCTTTMPLPTQSAWPSARLLFFAAIGIGVGVLAAHHKRSSGLRGAFRDAEADWDLADQSLTEEKRAIADYGRRAGMVSSRSLRRVFRHNQGDEREHAARLRRWERQNRR